MSKDGNGATEPNKWYLTGVRTARVKMQLQTNEIVDGTQIHLQFTDQQPSIIQTKRNTGNQKAAQFAIPDGVPVEAVYDLFSKLPGVIDQHLNPEANSGEEDEADQGRDSPEPSE